MQQSRKLTDYLSQIKKKKHHLLKTGNCVELFINIFQSQINSEQKTVK